jgi:hypothetical protein
VFGESWPMPNPRITCCVFAWDEIALCEGRRGPAAALARFGVPHELLIIDDLALTAPARKRSPRPRARRGALSTTARTAASAGPRLICEVWRFCHLLSRGWAVPCHHPRASPTGRAGTSCWESAGRRDQLSARYKGAPSMLYRAVVGPRRASKACSSSAARSLRHVAQEPGTRLTVVWEMLRAD